MADQIRIPITVCHYPPGTSKWNKIERRLFSFISLNRRGQPLINYETIVNLIGGTKRRTGLKVKAVLGTNEYETESECPTSSWVRDPTPRSQSSSSVELHDLTSQAYVSREIGHIVV
jgi:Rhodopirellula transposase DDE domain